MNTLDLDAVQVHLERMEAWELRPAHHRRHRLTTEEGRIIVHGYHPDYIASLIAVTEDVPALVSEVERQAAVIASLEQMWADYSAAPHGEIVPAAFVATELRGRLDTGSTATSPSDSSSTGSQS